MHEHRMLPLKKVHRDEAGHLRLVYWEGNEAMKGDPVALSLAGIGMEHPAGEYPKDRYSLETGQDRIMMRAGRDGMLVMLPGKHDLDTGLIVEGSITAAELSLRMITHMHAAVAGFYIEEAPEKGTALLLETLGVTRIGSFAYAEEPITDQHDYSKAAIQARTQSRRRNAGHQQVRLRGRDADHRLRHRRRDPQEIQMQIPPVDPRRDLRVLPGRSSSPNLRLR